MDIKKGKYFNHDGDDESSFAGHAIFKQSISSMTNKVLLVTKSLSKDDHVTSRKYCVTS